jgi:hypothetical protein
LPKLSITNRASHPFGNSTPTRVKFRRLFADGQALVKCEIGLAGKIFHSDWGVDYDFMKIIDDVLASQCRVPGEGSSPLAFAGKALAARYLECSTKRAVDPAEIPQAENADGVDSVVAGDPLVFIDVSCAARISLPSGYVSVVMPGNFDFQIFYGHYPKGSFRVPVWILVRSFRKNRFDNDARHLRIYLQRIHAEKEVLRIILNNIASGALKIDGNPKASDLLQRYLQDTMTRIIRLELKADKKSIEGIGATAAFCLEFVRPGWRDALSRRLDLMNIRPNIRRNIETRVRREGALVNYGVINVDQSHSDNRRGAFMGDTFSNITNSTIVNRSFVENAFNKAKSEVGEDTAAMLLKVAEVVAQSGNKEAGELLDQFNEELSKPQPRKSLLKRSWDGLVAALPTVTAIAGAAAAIAKLFA